MKVILTETIESLGIIGSEVDVADGYARNYLLPQKKAMPATPQNNKILQQQKAKFDLQIAKEKGLAQEMAERLKDMRCIIPAKVHEEDKLYGSITTRDIIDALGKKNIEVGKRMVLLSAPIKTLGEFKIPIRIYSEVEPEIIVEIVAED